MDDAKMRQQVDRLIKICESLHGAIPTEEHAFQVLQGTAGIIEVIYGRESTQLSTFMRVSSLHTANIHINVYRKTLVELCLGALRNVVSELNGGLIGSIRRRAAAEVLTDFVALSRASLEDGAKDVAAVLAAAAFEDSLRRLGAIHAGTTDGEKLANVVTSLKNSGFLKGPQVGIAQSYLSFRNHAMHGQWDKIESEAVISVLGFVEQLVLKHFQ